MSDHHSLTLVQACGFHDDDWEPGMWDVAETLRCIEHIARTWGCECFKGPFDAGTEGRCMRLWEVALGLCLACSRRQPPQKRAHSFRMLGVRAGVRAFRMS